MCQLQTVCISHTLWLSIAHCDCQSHTVVVSHTLRVSVTQCVAVTHSDLSVSIVIAHNNQQKMKGVDNETFSFRLATHFSDTESTPAHVAAIDNVDALVVFYALTASVLLEQHAAECDVTFRERRSSLMMCDAKTRSRYLE